MDIDLGIALLRYPCQGSSGKARGKCRDDDLGTCLGGGFLRGCLLRLNLFDAADTHNPSDTVVVHDSFLRLIWQKGWELASGSKESNECVGRMGATDGSNDRSCRGLRNDCTVLHGWFRELRDLQQVIA